MHLTYLLHISTKTLLILALFQTYTNSKNYLELNFFVFYSLQALFCRPSSVPQIQPAKRKQENGLLLAARTFINAEVFLFHPLSIHSVP